MGKFYFMGNIMGNFFSRGWCKCALVKSLFCTFLVGIEFTKLNLMWVILNPVKHFIPYDAKCL